MPPPQIRPCPIPPSPTGPDLDKVGPWGHAQFGAPQGQTQTTFGQMQFLLQFGPGADLALDHWDRGMSRRTENHEILERASGEFNFLNYFNLRSLSELWRYH